LPKPCGLSGGYQQAAMSSGEVAQINLAERSDELLRADRDCLAAYSSAHSGTIDGNAIRPQRRHITPVGTNF
jgi:hypothetical protein